MNPWSCAFIISTAGAIGGIINALLSDNKFFMPKIKDGILCPGALTNILVGATSAFASWSLYGSGASVELAKATANARQDISLTFAALAGAFLVGLAGSKWLTNEADKRFLKETVKIVAKKDITADECEKILQQSPRKILNEVQIA